MTQGPPPPRADLEADPQHVLPMLDASPVAMMFSVGTAVRYANAASVQLLGYQAGEQATNLYVDVQQRDAIRAALARGEPVRGQEARLRAKDGTVRTVLLTLMRWQMNGEDGFVGWSVDITERRQAEQQFRDFARASNDWFWETDAQHRFSAFYSGAEPFSEERTTACAARPAGSCRGRRKKRCGPNIAPHWTRASRFQTSNTRPSASTAIRAGCG